MSARAAFGRPSATAGQWRINGDATQRGEQWGGVVSIDPPGSFR